MLAATLAEKSGLALNDLLLKVYRDSGYDFRDYRPSTIIRRLARRLHVTGAATYQEYMRFMETHPGEYQRLADDLTIKVSGFFRSPYSCQRVTELVLPALVQNRDSGGEKQIAVWSAACGRGEEPYSAAILLSEFLGPTTDIKARVYATDISRQALSEARTGMYSPGDVSVPPALLRNYFTRHSQGYQVIDAIRQMVSFDYFDLTSTTRPPFADLDCVFCCNVLIYFQKHLQERVLNMLYDSLATPGYLVLGEVETPTGNLSGKLECLDHKARIYKKA